MPSAKDVVEYNRGFARVVDLPLQPAGTDAEPACGRRALQEARGGGAEGYAGEVPVIHQAVAVKAAIDALNNCFAQDAEEGF